MFEPTQRSRRMELAERESQGVVVRLLWSRSTNLVTVTVDDGSSGEHFELVLDGDESALDVFHHPFAHAAARGLDVGVERSPAQIAA